MSLEEISPNCNFPRARVHTWLIGNKEHKYHHQNCAKGHERVHDPENGACEWVVTSERTLSR